MTDPKGPDLEQAFARAVRRRISPAGIKVEAATPAQSIDDLQAVQLQDARQDLKLKGRYAAAALTIVAIQLTIANGAFIAYICGLGRGREIDPTVLHSFLAATVVESIGIVLVITRYLFSRPQSSN